MSANSPYGFIGRVVIKKLLLKFANIKLSRKLPMLFTLIALIAGGTVGYFAEMEAEHEALHEIELKLDAIVQARKDEFARYLRSIRQDLRFNAANPLVLQAQKDFAAAWNDIGVNGFDQTEYLQNWYIEDNPHPTGKKDELDFATDGSPYSEVHGRYHPWFRTFLRERGYYDIFLFDLEGNLLYTVFKELDYATNLNTGQWKDTDLGNAFRAARDGAEGAQIFFDFKPYAPSHGAPASFISQPITSADGVISGVLVYQMPIDGINEIMKSAVGLGNTGEVSLYGADFKMRNDSRLSEESTILKRELDSEAVKAALAGNMGHSIDIDHNGESVYVSYAPLEFLNSKFAVVASETEAEIMQPIYAIRQKIGMEILAVIAFSTLLGILFARSISRRVAALADSVSLVAKGENAEIPSLESGDEIGDIARALQTINEIGQSAIRIQRALDGVSSNVMMADANYDIIYANHSVIDTLKNAEADIRKELSNFDASNLVGQSIDQFHKHPEHQRKMVEQLNQPYRTSITVGGRTFNLIATPVFSDNGERLGTVVEWSDVTLELAIEEEVANVVEATTRGNFNQRLDTEGKEGFMLKLSEGMNQIGEVSLKGLSEVVKVLNSLSQGHLTDKIEGEYEGLFDEIKQALNDTIEKLQDMVGKIQHSAGSVNSAANEISSGSADLSHRTEQQASTLEETAASMEEMTATVRQNSENASKANDTSNEASKVATKGGEVVEQAVEAMSKIEESSKKIADIIGVIDEIAFQTNLLALNAAVEAARAGDAGKGFAVVASEVRSLAGRSAEASKDIKELIGESVNQVSEGSELVNQAGETLQQIVDSVQQAAKVIEEIAEASQEQATSIEEINTAVTQMDEGTQQNAALVQENTAAAQSLVDQSEDLEQLMSFFKLDESEEASPESERIVKLSEAREEKSAPTSTPPKPMKKAAGAENYDQGWEEF